MKRLMTVCCLGLLAGCSSGPEPQSPEEAAGQVMLHEVGGMIQLYSGEANKGPSKPADLAKFQNGYPIGYEGLKSGEVVVEWGATMAGEGEIASGGGSEAVLAYEKKATQEGGYVLLQNGNVKKMTAAELQSAPKAK